MLWPVKEPRPAVLTHVGGNILHIVLAEMQKVGVEDQQRGVKLGAMRVEVGSKSTHIVLLNKKTQQNAQENDNLCWVGVIIYMGFLYACWNIEWNPWQNWPCDVWISKVLL